MEMAKMYKIDLGQGLFYEIKLTVWDYKFFT